jgi:hypothetical protein
MCSAVRHDSEMQRAGWTSTRPFGLRGAAVQGIWGTPNAVLRLRAGK